MSSHDPFDRQLHRLANGARDFNERSGRIGLGYSIQARLQILN